MKKHNNIVVVTGISASGKDYLLGRTINATDDKVSILPFGSMLAERIQGNSSERDGLRELDPSLVASFAKTIIDEVVCVDRTMVINTHVAYRSKGLVVANPGVDRQIRPRDYIFIAAEPEEIAARRQLDVSRERELEDVEDIALHQEIAQGVVSGMARVLGSRLTVIENNPYNVAQNVLTMKEVIYA